MVRQTVQARTTFAVAGEPQPGAHAPVRRSAARFMGVAVRLIVAPFALLAAAAAGIVFAALLPICGIASICEGIVKASWSFVRDACSRVPHLLTR